MAAPGVVVTTAVRSGPSGTPRAASGQYFVIGLAERGPTDVSVKLNSMGDYRRVFGERVTYGSLFDDLTLFFESGGLQARVTRVVGAAATKGTISISDGATTPVPTLRADAASEGAWSSRVKVVVAAGSGGAATRKVSVLLDEVVVEEYDGLGTIAAIVAKFAASPYVRFADLGSVTVAPGNLPVIGTYTLTAGNDDRASVNAARVIAKLGLFKPGDGDGAVAAPGFGQSVHAGLIAHAKGNRRIALLSAARGTTVTDLRDLGLTLAVDGQHAGLFGPHLVVGDASGGTRVVSPEGFVAAARAKTHEVDGPWASAAGELSISPYIVGVDQEFTKADRDVLDTGRVSPIATVSSRIRLYGWRSLSAAEADYGILTVQDTLNRISVECEARLEPFVHKTIDGRGQLFAAIAGVLTGVVETIRSDGGLYERIDPVTGDAIDGGYSVDVGPAINTVASQQTNLVNAVVAVRLSPTASLIALTIVKVGLTAAV